MKTKNKKRSLFKELKRGVKEIKAEQKNKIKLRKHEIAEQEQIIKKHDYPCKYLDSCNHLVSG